VAQAKVRLTKILTQAVGIVDRPANQRPFITLKSEAGVAGMDNGAGGSAPEAATPDRGSPDAPAATPLSMPKAVKAELSQALTSALDCLSKIAEQVSSSTEDDAAPVPVPLLEGLDQCADTLDMLADKWIGEGGPSSMGEATLAAPDAAQKAAADKPEPKPGDGRKMRLLAKKRMAVLDGAHKAIVAGHEGIGTGVAQMAALMAELSGEKIPVQVDKPVDDTNAAPNGGAVEKKTDLDEVKKAVTDALAPFVAALAATEKSLSDARASIGQLPNSPVNEGNRGAQSGEKTKTYKQMLADAKKSKG
jgi:hypothetical protein